MRQTLIPRARVHERSLAIGKSWKVHEAHVQRLLRAQPAVVRRVIDDLRDPDTHGVAMQLVGVILRMLELEGGIVHPVSAGVLERAFRVVGPVADTLPRDDGFFAAARAVDRPQGHVLDEVLYALFGAPATEADAALREERLRMYVTVWKVMEAVDHCWRPLPGAREAGYRYVPIDGDPPLPPIAPG